MATKSPPVPGNPDETSQGPGPELSKPADLNGQDAKGEANNESSEKFLANPEPMREDQVQNAVNFLSHPRVRGSPIIYRRSFLEKKGLTREEIDEAFRRVPDPPSEAETTEAAATNQAMQSKSSTSLQPQAPLQAPQPAAAPVVPSLQQSRFHWSHALVAAGVLAASGAGTAVFFKTVVVPRLKTWIRKVVAEEKESEKEDKLSSILAEQTAEAAKAAASAAAIVAKASEELFNSKNEERKHFEAFMGMMDVQVKEIKSMGDAIRKLENTRKIDYSQDKLVEEYIQSTTNGTTNNPWRGSQVNQPDASFSSMVSKQAKVNGTPNADFGTGPSSAPATVEPTTAPHPKSFMEIMAMVQRGERPPNIKEINDMPPNPNQQPTKPLLAPRAKPWEIPQQKSGHGLPYQPSFEGPTDRAEENSLQSHSNGKAHDASEWWKKKSVKITEIEPESMEEPRQQFPYSSGTSQRGWVPPQPPTVVMPEAAAAIRQPKSSVQKQQSGDERLMARSDDGEDGAARASEILGVESEASGSGVASESNQTTEIEEEGVAGVEVN